MQPAIFERKRQAQQKAASRLDPVKIELTRKANPEAPRRQRTWLWRRVRWILSAMEFANEISASFDKSLLPQSILAASTSHFHETQNFGWIKQTYSALVLHMGEAKIDPTR